MNSADTFEIQPDLFVYGGEVMGRLPDGRAVFIPYTLPGETVRIRLVDDKPRFARAELIEVIKPSDDRIKPLCPHFKACGGCHYQHLPYQKQIQIKAEILLDQLKRIGGIDQAAIDPCVESPLPFNYRNFIQFHVTPDGRLGFQAPRSHHIIPVSECHLPHPAINNLWPQLQIEPVPGLDQVGIRVTTDEELQVILESSQPEALEFGVESLPISVVHLGPGGCLVLAGSEAVLIELNGVEFQVSAGSFFQINPPVAVAMVQHLLDTLPLTPETTLLDVYCGVGFFSAFLAPKVKRLVGIEDSPYACMDFAVNLDPYDHIDLYEASAEVVLNEVKFEPDVILVDPPRSGLGKQTLDGLLSQQSEWLAYISCDPATLARDAKTLIKAGYRLSRVTPFDMFPQTYHIESISLWQR